MTRRRHPPPARRPDLTAAQILDWADAFHARVGRWPTRKDGRRCLPEGNWASIDGCLKSGSRGLNRGSSLAKLLLERRGRRHRGLLPPLTPALILGWADDHYARTGDWPTQYAGPVVDAPGETWSGVNCALHEGCRTLPGRSSIAQLLEAHRGVRNHLNLPPLTPAAILAWADAHHARTGRWPQKDADAGPIPDAPGETWAAVDQVLRVGLRGLPGGGSLARLLAAERGVRNPAGVPRLEAWEILVWADSHFDRTGRWPTAKCGAIPDAPGETWCAVDSSLWSGGRGLPGGDSLAKLLARRRGRRNPADRPPLAVPQILRWADAHHARTGAWPTTSAGPIPYTAGDTWSAVDRALAAGRRGLPGGSSLPQLLHAERGVRNPAAVPPLTADLILGWADAHHTRTGAWPNAASGPVDGVPGETWSAVAAALSTGVRGLTRSGSLTRFLAARRGVRNHMALPAITIEQVLTWADAHHARTGGWPTGHGGPIPDAPGETWRAVEAALRYGLRGMAGGDTLARLLARERGTRNRKALPPLALEQVRGWIVAHFERTGRWPTGKGGPIPEAPGETWSAVDQALYRGQRGMPGGSSLPKLVRECRLKTGGMEEPFPANTR